MRKANNYFNTNQVKDNDRFERVWQLNYAEMECEAAKYRMEEDPTLENTIKYTELKARLKNIKKKFKLDKRTYNTY